MPKRVITQLSGWMSGAVNQDIMQDVEQNTQGSEPHHGVLRQFLDACVQLYQRFSN